MGCPEQWGDDDEPGHTIDWPLIIAVAFIFTAFGLLIGLYF
jgi:hypothetical protein